MFELVLATPRHLLTLYVDGVIYACLQSGGSTNSTYFSAFGYYIYGVEMHAWEYVLFLFFRQEYQTESPTQLRPVFESAC